MDRERELREGPQREHDRERKTIIQPGSQSKDLKPDTVISAEPQIKEQPDTVIRIKNLKPDAIIRIKNLKPDTVSSAEPQIKDLKRDSPIMRKLPWIGKERMELTSVVQDRRALREGLSRLDKPAASDADIDAARTQLRQLPTILDSDPLWSPLTTAAAEAEKAGRADHQAFSVDEADLSSGPLAEVVEVWSRQLAAAGLTDLQIGPDGQAVSLPQQLARLLAEATSAQTDTEAQPVAQLKRPTEVIRTIRVEIVHSFVQEAQQLAAQPPGANEKSRATWIARAKRILSWAVDLLTNIAVATAFTAPEVQIAAQRVAHATGYLADRGVDQLGPAIPSLLAIAPVAAMGVVSVKLLRDLRG